MNILRTIRETQGLTQSQVAKKAEIALMTYLRYENPKYQRIPNAVTAIKIANALNTTVEKLWGYKEVIS